MPTPDHDADTHPAPPAAPSGGAASSASGAPPAAAAPSAPPGPATEPERSTREQTPPEPPAPDQPAAPARESDGSRPAEPAGEDAFEDVPDTPGAVEPGADAAQQPPAASPPLDAPGQEASDGPPGPDGDAAPATPGTEADADPGADTDADPDMDSDADPGAADAPETAGAGRHHRRAGRRGCARAGRGSAGAGRRPTGRGARAADDGRFKVVLDNFEGPFDLLLQLISKHKLDVTEVALSKVTDEFMAHIRAMGPDWDLDQTTEFLVVAATLLDLKAARLLPSAEVEDEADLALLEARDLLFARLLQYRASTRRSPGIFAGRMADEAHRHPRTVGLEPHHAELLPESRSASGPKGSRVSAVKAMQPKPKPQVYVEHIHAPLVSVREQAESGGGAGYGSWGEAFRQLTEDAPDTLTVVARFLALWSCTASERCSWTRRRRWARSRCAGAAVPRTRSPLVTDEFDQESAPGGREEVRARQNRGAGARTPSRRSHVQPAARAEPAGAPRSPRKRHAHDIGARGGRCEASRKISGGRVTARRTWPGRGRRRPPGRGRRLAELELKPALEAV